MMNWKMLITCWQKNFASSKYTCLGKMLIDGFHSVKPGGHYVEFEAPDLEGRVVNVSEEIKGKIAIIDLWASWCMPCGQRRK